MLIQRRTLTVISRWKNQRTHGAKSSCIKPSKANLHLSLRILEWMSRKNNCHTNYCDFRRIVHAEEAQIKCTIDSLHWFYFSISMVTFQFWRFTDGTVSWHVIVLIDIHELTIWNLPTSCSTWYCTVASVKLVQNLLFLFNCEPNRQTACFISLDWDSVWNRFDYSIQVMFENVCVCAWKKKNQSCMRCACEQHIVQWHVYCFCM